jgi:GTP-binding protein LepA
MDQRFVRNFSIIAHIDHGKSTLADRFLELTGALQAREMEAQVLDAMDLERERGITIKAHPVRLNYTALDGQQYVLNLIDTPGHVDFGYEVTRSLAACEGRCCSSMRRRASKRRRWPTRISPWTTASRSSRSSTRSICPAHSPTSANGQIEDIIGLDASTAILASAKDGTGVRDILEAIVERFHPPKGDPNAPLKALIFDSWYDAYRGVVIVVRVIDGVLKPKTKVRLMAMKQDYEVLELGVFSPKATPVDELGVGEVGFVVANIKVVADAKIGDTVTETHRPTTEPFPGFKELKPMVFAGLYPVESHQYAELRERSRSCG